MNKLIKNELIKIFHKKGIYVTLLIMFAFVVLINFIYKNSYDKDGYLKGRDYTVEELADYKTQLKAMDSSNEEQAYEYISIKTYIDIDELKIKYGVSSWQSYVLDNYLYDVVYKINQNEILNNVDAYEIAYANSSYNTAISNFEKDNWRYFVEDELENTNSQIQIYKDQLETITDKLELKYINESISSLESTKNQLQYRLDNNISYERTYLNDAFTEYNNLSKFISSTDEEDLKTYDEKYQYNQNKSNMEIDKYIYENKVNAKQENNIKGILSNLFDEFEIFIVIIISVVIGIIIAEEFSKGTIKQLLTKPYKRNEILLSKFIVSLFIILFSVISLIIMELIVGGIIFGYSSLSIPVVIYNFSNSTVQAYNIFHYIFIVIINKLPLFILISTFMLFLGVLTTNSAITIAIGLVIYMASAIINNIAYYFDVVFLRYFPTLNWDLSIYMFGNMPINRNLNYNLSIIMCILYFLLMIIPTFIIFKKKNIKNI